MARMVTQVTAGQQPPRELALRAEVPLLERRRFGIERRVDVDARGRERTGPPAIGERREGIAAGIRQIRIREATGRTGECDLRAPRGVVGEAGIEEKVRRVVEPPPAAAKRRLLV